MESRNLLPQNTRTSLSIVKHSACKLVREVNVLQGFDNSRHIKLFKNLLVFHSHFCYNKQIILLK